MKRIQLNKIRKIYQNVFLKYVCIKHQSNIKVSKVRKNTIFINNDKIKHMGDKVKECVITAPQNLKLI